MSIQPVIDILSTNTLNRCGLLITEIKKKIVSKDLYGVLNL